ncbi:MAG TPA: TIM-barrel domain-containing protein [Chitinophagaceae bacterium]
MFQRLATFILFIFFGVATCAQQSIGDLKKRTSSGNNFYFSNTSGDVAIEFCTASMFRVRYSWSRSFEENEPWMVMKYNFPKVDVISTENKDYVLLKTSQLQVKIFKSPFYIDVLKADGTLLSSEKNIRDAAFKKVDTVSCTKQLLPDEHFFGFGERMDFIDQHNKKIKLKVGRGEALPYEVGAYNILEANYCPVPFFMSTKSYGIFFHNAFPTEWNMGSENKDRFSFKAQGGELDYYFIYGPKFPAILDSYTSLTGKSPMVSLFALGLHLGTYSGGGWGYEKLTSDKYVIALARKLREMGIPVDLLWLDSTWRIFGEVGGKGATSFEWRETFKDPKGMFDSLYAMKYKMVGLHLRPRFDNGHYIKLLDTAQKLKYTYPEGNSPGEFVNFFDSAAVDFWWKHGVMRVGSVGAKFLKTDEGSAFGALANESNKIGPTGKDIAKLHNIFPLAYAKAPFEKFQQYNGLRGLNQTREGYAGIQRYPFIFAGDWPSEWQYFAPVIKAGINIGLSGVGYWGHCMGGFEHIADPELYVRWVQFGMFSPIAMVFGFDHPYYKLPWGYGDDALRNFKKYDSLRYQLLPYIYSNAYTQYKTGRSLMSGLVMDYQDDGNVYEISDQYMFGNNMMICPVTVKGSKTRSIYLPEGTWFDYWSGKEYSGKQYIHVITPLDTLPIFVKSGSIIPMQRPMIYLGEKPVDIITLEFFPGVQSSFDLYEDDGTSLQYQQGDFAITKISTNLLSNILSVKIQKPLGKFIPPTHTYLAKIHLQYLPSKIKENGEQVDMISKGDVNVKKGWYYDENEKIVWIRSALKNTSEIEWNISKK